MANELQSASNTYGTAGRADYAVRFAAPDDAGVFIGHAAIFDQINGHNETLMRGAFKRTIADHAARGIAPPMLWSHDPADVIGVWTDIREDGTGLAVTGKLVIETRRGAEALALLKAGALSGLSIGFRGAKSSKTASGVRAISDLDLIEISLVALPSAGNARVTNVRSDAAFTRAVASAIATLKGK